MSQHIDIDHGLVVLAVMPGPTPPGCAIPEGWMQREGAPGCTGESLALEQGIAAIRSQCGDLAIILVSSQSKDEQEAFRTSKGVTLPMVSDPNFELQARFGEDVLPTFEHLGRRYYKRRILILEDGKILTVREVPEPKEAPSVIRQALRSVKVCGND